jgi:threonine/homoserine/homoserine lactone efflux protein
VAAVIVDLPAYLAVAVVLIVTPGPDTALTIRNALLGGRRAGLSSALGVSSGQAVWALATSVGLAALLAASEPVFVALKLAGAAYLVFLGLHSLWAAVRRRSYPPPDGAQPGGGLVPRAAYRQGVLSNLANPKMAVFFTSLLPQFTSGGPAFAGLLALGLLFSLLTLVWLGAYAVAVARAGRLLRRPAVRRALDAVTGAVLVALGLRLGAERR